MSFKWVNMRNSDVYRYISSKNGANSLYNQHCAAVVTGLKLCLEIVVVL